MCFGCSKEPSHRNISFKCLKHNFMIKGKQPKPRFGCLTPVFDHSNYRLFERIPAVPGTSNNRGLTVFGMIYTRYF